MKREHEAVHGCLVEQLEPVAIAEKLVTRDETYFIELHEVPTVLLGRAASCCLGKGRCERSAPATYERTIEFSVSRVGRFRSDFECEKEHRSTLSRDAA
jgi:hypothetical protein